MAEEPNEAQKLTVKLEENARSLGMQPTDELHTSEEVKKLAQEGWETGSLIPDEIKLLSGAVMRHIERHQASKKDA